MKLGSHLGARGDTEGTCIKAVSPRYRARIEAEGLNEAKTSFEGACLRKSFGISLGLQILRLGGRDPPLLG